MSSYSKKHRTYYLKNKKVLNRKLRDVAYSGRLKKYNLSQEAYDVLFESQKGLCKICGKLGNNGRRLAIDHCHSTKRVRGLLCTNCNIGLGNFQDNKEFLLKAVEYLK